MIQSITKERLATFSDGVFAGIITIIVLQLRLPHHPTFSAFLEEWPTALSYIVSYFLIVIMWINHRYLWGFAEHSTPKLILWNGGPCVRLRGRHHFGQALVSRICL